MPDPSQMTGLQWISLVLVGLILIGLQGYVAKKAANAATQEDIAKLTRVVEDIKAEHARDLERLKSTLLKDVESHRIQYETELRSYQEIWAAAYQVYLRVGGLRRFSSGADQEERQMADDAQMAYLQAATAYGAVLWKQRPFFPDELYLELTKLGLVLQAEYFQSQVARNTGQTVNDAETMRRKILESIDATCEAIRRRLHSASQGEQMTRIESPPTS
jgi:hypothetical protein